MKVNTNSISINNIALLAESEEELSLMLNYLDTTLSKFSLKININKTKVGKLDQQNTTNIKIRDEPVEQIKEFCYL